MCQDRAKPHWVFAVSKVLCVNGSFVSIDLGYVPNTIPPLLVALVSSGVARLMRKYQLLVIVSLVYGAFSESR